MRKSHVRSLLKPHHMEQETFSEVLLDEWISVFGSRTSLAEVRLCSLLFRLEWEHEHVSLSRLTEESTLPRSSVNRLLYNMYEAGIIKYEEHPEDRRKKLVRHTRWFVEKAVRSADRMREQYGLILKDPRNLGK